MDAILLPFHYSYMCNAIVVSSIVGALCGFLSVYLMVRNWSLIGHALSHAVVPGIVVTYIMGAALSFGAFVAAALAALGMSFVNLKTKLKPDGAIGVMFVTFLSAGLFIASLSPIPVDINNIIFGNILTISPSDFWQLIAIATSSLLLLLFMHTEILLMIFDPSYARSIGLSPERITIMFFGILAACVVASMETVGALLVIAMIVTPGATAFLLTSRFYLLLTLATGIGASTSFVGSYLSFFLNGATGGLIVLLQSLIFFSVLICRKAVGHSTVQERQNG